MGYTTQFEGQFDITPALKPEHKAYLEAFANTRRMKRNPQLLPPDPIRESVGLPVGTEGAYFVGGLGVFGQEKDASVLDFNRQPKGQPELWCQWVPNDTGDALVWDGGEKFYCYVEWLSYLLEHFLKSWGYSLNGSVKWQGEEDNDFGTIVVENNNITVVRG